MKRITIHLIVILTALSLTWSGLPAATAKAEEVLRYSCSNQVFSAIDKEKVAAFSKATGIEVKIKKASSFSVVYQVMNGFSDVAGTSRALGRRHADYGFTQIPFCKDALTIIVHTGCPVNSVTEQQLQGIFSGMITNWNEIGGRDLPIKVIVPGKDTAANKNFRRQVMKHQEIEYDLMTWDSTMAVEAVRYFPCGSVSFIARGVAAREKGVKILRVNGLLPTDRKYPYFQIFYYITKGEPKGIVKQFIDFTFSETGKKLIEQNGMVPLER